VKGIRERHGVCDKVTSLGRRGFFDRIAVLPGGRVFFVELKRPKGGRLSPHQRDRHDDYALCGAVVVVLHSREQVDHFFRAVDRLPSPTRDPLDAKKPSEGDL
jgi:hypothetical protein